MQATYRYPQGLTRRAFNLIEVVLALSVIAIGMLAIMGLIPIGTSATRDAIANNYAADAAEQSLHQFASYIRADWTTHLGYIPEVDGAADIDQGIDGSEGWTKMDEDSGELQQATRNGDIIYRLRNVNAADSTKSDFEALIRVWRTASTAYEFDPSIPPSGEWTSNTDTSHTGRVQLNMEITWPATVQYSRRQKALYSLEVVR